MEPWLDLKVVLEDFVLPPEVGVFVSLAVLRLPLPFKLLPVVEGKTFVVLLLLTVVDFVLLLDEEALPITLDLLLLSDEVADLTLVVVITVFVPVVGHFVLLVKIVVFGALFAWTALFGLVVTAVFDALVTMVLVPLVVIVILVMGSDEAFAPSKDDDDVVITVLLSLVIKVLLSLVTFLLSLVEGHLEMLEITTFVPSVTPDTVLPLVRSG